MMVWNGVCGGCQMLMGDMIHIRGNYQLNEILVSFSAILMKTAPNSTEDEIRPLMPKNLGLIHKKYLLTPLLLKRNQILLKSYNDIKICRSMNLS